LKSNIIKKRYTPWLNFKTMLKRELMLSIIDHKTLYVICASILIILLTYYFISLEFGQLAIGFLLVMPVLNISIVIIIYSSTIISRDIDSGTFDLLRLGPSKGIEYPMAKITFCAIQYLLLNTIFLLIITPFMWAYGWLLFEYAIISIYGPLFLVFLFFSALQLIFSTIIKKESGSIALGFLFSIYLVLSSRSFTVIDLHYRVVNLNFQLTEDLLHYYSGYNFNILLWGIFLIMTILLNIGVLALLRKEWMRRL